MLQTGLVKTPDLIKRLLLLLAHQAGSEVSVNELAAQLQIARPMVNRFLDLLEPESEKEYEGNIAMESIKTIQAFGY